ncbi:MAG: hypothetical protein QOE63_237, partial [Acidimicrobiaceae bacterium]
PSTAQASLDQFSSTAFAAAPYPGDLIASLPTTINGLGAGSLPPAPAYPFIVSSDAAVTPSAKQEVGPYSISADSTDLSSIADAHIGLQSTSPQVVAATAHSTVTRDATTNHLVADATTTVEPVRINDLLALGEIRTTAHVEYDPNDPSGGVIKSTSTSVGTITIAGIELGLTDKGLSLAGTSLLPIDISVLTNLLAPTGFTIGYIPAEETDTSISSAAVQLTYKGTFPSPFLDTTVRFPLGRATVSALPGNLPKVAPLVAAPVVAPAASGSGGGSTPVGSGAAPTVGTPVATAPVEDTSPSITSTFVPGPLADLGRFYLILVGGALVALTSSRLTQWTAFRLRLANPGAQP